MCIISSSLYSDFVYMWINEAWSYLNEARVRVTGSGGATGCRIHHYCLVAGYEDTQKVGISRKVYCTQNLARLMDMQQTYHFCERMWVKNR